MSSYFLTSLAKATNSQGQMECAAGFFIWLPWKLPRHGHTQPVRPDFPQPETAQYCCLPTSFANFSVSSAPSPSSSPHPKSTRPPISLFPEYLIRSILPVTLLWAGEDHLPRASRHRRFYCQLHLSVRPSSPLLSPSPLSKNLQLGNGVFAALWAFSLPADWRLQDSPISLHLCHGS